MLTTVFRVQFSLIIVATCMLPEKKACSLFSIHSHQNSVTNTPKVPTCSDPISNFMHIMRFRTNKHKKQKLFFKKNWRSILRRISNFRKKYKMHLNLNKNRVTEKQETNKIKPESLLSRSTEKAINSLVFGLSIITLPGLFVLFLATPKVQILSKFLYNHTSDRIEKMAFSYPYTFSRLHYMYICSVFLGNMAIVSFFTALVLEYFPTSTGSYLLSIGPTLENVLQFCSFSTFMCLYFMLLYMGHYGILALLLIMAVLFVQFTGEPLTFSNFWSSDTLFGISATFEFMLVDLFNMFLSLPGNILCFIPQFQTLMIQVFVKDWHGKTHIFRLPKNATASDLRKQISIKFKLSRSHYWLNGPQGHNLENHQELHNLDTIHIRGRLFGGTNMCCIKGCSQKASNRNISCLAGVYELKIPPHILRQASDLCNLYICNYHYYFHQKRGHKPRRLYSSVEYAKKILLSNKSELNDYSTSLDVKTCTLCKKNVVVTTKTPCLQHTLSLSSQNFMCACNCLDEIIDGKIQNMKIKMYDCIESKAESLSRKSDLVEGYICTECGPTH